MKKIYDVILMFAIMATLGSCSKEKWDFDTDDSSYGEVSLSSMTVDVTNAEEVIARSSVDLSDFIVKIYDATDNSLVKQWTYAEMPEVFTLPVGEYYVNVISHVQEASAWDKPYFEGSKTFAIQDARITEIGEVICKLANVKVSIRYSDALRAVMGDDVVVTVLMNDGGSLTYTPSETRAGYFKYIADSHTLVATFTGTVDGNKETLRKEYTDIAAGQHRIITFKLKTGDGTIPDENGGISIDGGISVDASVTTVDLTSDIDVEEDIIDGDRPQEGGDDNQDPEQPDEPQQPDTPTETITITSETLDFENPNIATADMQAIVNIHSDEGIANFKVDIISDQLTPEVLSSVGLAASFDLAYPGSLEYAIKNDLEFPVGDEVIGAKDLVFDITKFIPFLMIYEGTHNFKLTITDAAGATLDKTLTFLVQ